MSVQWGMLSGLGNSNVLDLYRAGVADRRQEQQYQRQQATDQRQEKLRELLMSAYDPESGRVDPGKVRNAYAQAGNIEGLMEMDANSAKAAQQNMPTLLRLVDDTTDQASYDQARATAQRLGIDVSGLPDVFSPEIASQAKQALSAIAPQADKPYRWRSNDGSLMEIGADGNPKVVFDDPDTRPQFVPDGMGGGTWASPPMGGQPAQGGGGPQPGAVEDGYRFRGGNPADPNAWEPVGQGGPTQPASGGFPR